MQQGTLRVEDRQRVVLVPENLNAFEYDSLDIIVLNKFLRNTSYTVNELHNELIEEGRVNNICLETVRGRLEKYVARQLVHRIKDFVIVYDLNDSAAILIKNLILRHLAILGITELL